MVGRVRSRYLDIRRIVTIVDKELFFSRWKGQLSIDLTLEHLLNSIQDVDSPSIFSYRNAG